MSANGEFFDPARMFSLEDRQAFITGGGSGIGAATTEAMGAMGAHVTVADIDGAAAKEQAKFLSRHGVSAEWVELDVTNSEWVKSVVDESAVAMDGLSIVVNSAGVNPEVLVTRNGETHYDELRTGEVTPDVWDRTMAVNVNGARYVSQAALPHLREAAEAGRGPSIVNVSSVVRGGQIGTGPYAPSKAAIAIMGKNLAAEEGRNGIRVVNVGPGYTRTPMIEGVPASVIEKLERATALKRIADPREIGGMIAVFASPVASYLTRETVDVAGGLPSETV